MPKLDRYLTREFTQTVLAAFVVLEPLGKALARNATIYGIVAGYGRNADAYHITQPSPGGSSEAVCGAVTVLMVGSPHGPSLVAPKRHSTTVCWPSSRPVSPSS